MKRQESVFKFHDMMFSHRVCLCAFRFTECLRWLSEKSLPELFLLSPSSICFFDQNTENLSSEKTHHLMKLVEHPLRCIVFCSQVRASLWVRNGLSVEERRLSYSHVDIDNMHDIDFFLIQSAAMLIGPHFVNQALDRFSLTGWFLGKNYVRSGMNVTEVDTEGIEQSRIVILAEDFIRLFYLLLSDTSMLYDGDHAEHETVFLRRHIVHRLCASDLPHSAIVESLPGRFRNSTKIDVILDSVAHFVEPSAAIQQGMYRINPDCWNEYDPFFLHFRHEDIQQAELAYGEFIKQAAKTRSSSEQPLPLPFPSILPKPERFSEKLKALAASPLLLACAVAVFDRVIEGKVFSEKLLNLTLSLVSVIARLAPSSFFSTGAAPTTSSLGGAALGQMLSSFARPVSSRQMKGMSDVVPRLLTSLALLSTDRKAEHVRLSVIRVCDMIFARSPDAKTVFDRALATAALPPAHHPNAPAGMKLPEAPATDAQVEDQAAAAKAAAKARQMAVMERLKQQQSKFLGTIGDDDDDDDDDNDDVEHTGKDEPAQTGEQEEGSDSDYQDAPEPEDAESLGEEPSSKRARHVDEGLSFIPTASSAAASRKKKAESESLFRFGPHVRNKKPEFASFTADHCVLCQEKGAKDQVMGIVTFFQKTKFVQQTAAQQQNTLQDALRARGAVSLDDSSPESARFDADDLPLTPQTPLPTLSPLVTLRQNPGLRASASPALVSPRASRNLSINPLSPLPDLETEPQTGDVAQQLMWAHFAEEGVFVQSCGHTLHLTCFERYISTLQARHTRGEGYEGRDFVDLSRGMFLCPLCRRLSNGVLPLGDVAPLHTLSNIMPEPENEAEIKDTSAPSFVRWAFETFQSLPITSSAPLETREPMVAAFRQFLRQLQNESLAQNGKQRAADEPLYSVCAWRALATTISVTEVSTRPYAPPANATPTMPTVGSPLVMDGKQQKPKPIITTPPSPARRNPAIAADAAQEFREPDASTVRVSLSALSDHKRDLLYALFNVTLAMGVPEEETALLRQFRSCLIFEGAPGTSAAKLPKALLQLDLFQTLVWVVMSTPALMQPQRYAFTLRILRLALVLQTLITLPRFSSVPTRYCQESEMETLAPTERSLTRLFALLLNVPDGVLPCAPSYMVRIVEDAYLVFLRRAALFGHCCLSFSPPNLTTSVVEADLVPLAYWEELLRLPALDADLDLLFVEESGDSDHQAPSLRNVVIHWLQELEATLPVAPSTPITPLTPRTPLSWSEAVPRSYSAHLLALATMMCTPTTLGLFVPFTLIPLPQLFQPLCLTADKMVCCLCHKTPREPAMCLVCGLVVCITEDRLGQPRQPELVGHAASCGGGGGLYLLPKHSGVVLLRGARMTMWGSPYVDNHREQDLALRRGKPLHLAQGRVEELRKLWVGHGVEEELKKRGVKIIHEGHLFS
eukprot:TRINITY_DN2008_c0_g1_i7.p1 TRINITY_DN2008_c0_g1~~TRINITY_DN2008_c0_g1_i7.p1  ORF type:complete len:1429 (+),score=316.64 TRINITY_DN2008_c0_g1_i7:1514-5800(+)